VEELRKTFRLWQLGTGLMLPVALAVLLANEYLSVRSFLANERRLTLSLLERRFVEEHLSVLAEEVYLGIGSLDLHPGGSWP